LGKANYKIAYDFKNKSKLNTNEEVIQIRNWIHKMMDIAIKSYEMEEEKIN